MTHGNSRLTKFGLQLAVIAFTLLIAFSAGAAEYVAVNKDGVNIRSGPSTSSEILWEVFKDFPLEVVERKGEWVQTVDFEGDKGWVHAQLLDKRKMLIIKVPVANMRIGAGTNYEVVATVKYGVVFKPLEEKGEWVKVQHADGTVGWLFKKLLWPSD